MQDISRLFQRYPVIPEQQSGSLFTAYPSGSMMDSLSIMVNATLKRCSVETFNGDDTDFEPCETPEDEGLLRVGEGSAEERVKD